MAKKQVPERKSPESADTLSRADELISSYLGDLFGAEEAAPQVSGADDKPFSLEKLDEAELQRQVKAALSSSTIERGHSLISTIDLMAVAQSKSMLSKPQSFLMLLISLYYLRRPLPEKVKRCFLDVSERMLEDYEAADWQAQIARPGGVLSEARS